MKSLVIKAHMLLAQKKAELAGSRDRGATAVEYGLIVALIAVVIIVAVTLLGGALLGHLRRGRVQRVRRAWSASSLAPHA